MTVPMARPGGFYGGDQHWFPARRQQVRGCGAVAACNLLAARAAGGGPLGPLAPDGAGTREGFLAFMQQLYARLGPGPVGVWSRKRWTRAVLAWGEERGVPLRAESVSYRAGEAACTAFLREQLARGRPVAALSLRVGWPRRRPYDWHWLVITGLEGETMTLSSWGRQLRESWPVYYRRAHRALLQGGLVTIEQAHPL